MADRPILAATACAISMSKPTACCVEGSIDSCGGLVASDRKVRVPGRTRLAGGVMVGGVGLVTASPDAEGLVWTIPGVGGAHAASANARMALTAAQRIHAVRRPPSPRPRRVFVLAKICDPNFTTAAG